MGCGRSTASESVSVGWLVSESGSVSVWGVGVSASGAVGWLSYRRRRRRRFRLWVRGLILSACVCRSGAGSWCPGGFASYEKVRMLVTRAMMFVWLSVVNFMVPATNNHEK